MNIKIANLEPNPFRNLNKYPLSREKIDGLKTSVKENGFWGGILVRKHPTQKDKYQMAFGHHRYQALKELRYDYADNTVVFKLTDDDMHHRMFAENHETWGARPSCILENVESTRDRLNSILAKGWKDCGENTRVFFDSQHAFEQAMRKEGGVGRHTILKYLGGLYNENQVKDALYILKESAQPDSDISLDAVKELPTMSHVEHFRKAVKEHETPKGTQKKIAEEIVREGVGRRGVADIVAKFSPPIPNLKKKKTRQIKNIPNIIEYVFKCENDTDNLNRRVKALLPEINEIADKGRLLGRLAPALKRLEETISLFSTEYERIQNGKKKETKKVASVQVLD